MQGNQAAQFEPALHVVQHMQMLRAQNIQRAIPEYNQKKQG